MSTFWLFLTAYDSCLHLGHFFYSTTTTTIFFPPHPTFFPVGSRHLRYLYISKSSLSTRVHAYTCTRLLHVWPCSLSFRHFLRSLRMSFPSFSFLDASSHLYKSMCRRSVMSSVRNALWCFRKKCKKRLHQPNSIITFQCFRPFYAFLMPLQSVRVWPWDTSL